MFVSPSSDHILENRRIREFQILLNRRWNIKYHLDCGTWIRGSERAPKSTNFKLLAFRFILFCGKTDLKWGTKSSNNNTDAHNFEAIKTEIMRTCVCQRIRCVSMLASAWLPSPSPSDGWIHFYQRLMFVLLCPHYIEIVLLAKRIYGEKHRTREVNAAKANRTFYFILFFCSDWRLAFVIPVIKTHSFFLRALSDTKMYAGQRDQ